MAMAAPLQRLQGILARVLLADRYRRLPPSEPPGATSHAGKKTVATDNQLCYSPFMITLSRSPSVTAMVPEGPALAGDAEKLYDALEDLLRVYRSRARDWICCFDTSFSRCYALEALVRRGVMTLTAHAAHVYFEKGATTRVI